jgi:hypothetical protein
MKKEQIALSDGRYLIFYDFEDEKQEPPKPKRDEAIKEPVKPPEEMQDNE